ALKRRGCTPLFVLTALRHRNICANFCPPSPWQLERIVCRPPEVPPYHCCATPSHSGAIARRRRTRDTLLHNKKQPAFARAVKIEDAACGCCLLAHPFAGRGHSGQQALSIEAREYRIFL